VKGTEVAKFGIVSLKGASGRSYSFDAYPRDAEFNALGAVYVPTVRTPKAGGGASHDVVYVGQTGDLSSRPLNHHKTACFDRHSANCLLIHLEAKETVRLDVEGDLIAAYKPPCNG
jgi:hypothetical protein